MRIVSLDHLTVFELTPPELVSTASRAGFSHVGVRLQPAAPGEKQHPMIGDTPMLRETFARMADTGVRVLDAGVSRLRKDMDIAGLEPVFATAAKLGAAHVVVNGDERDETALAELFAGLCDLGRLYSLTVNFEATPWTGVRTLTQAARIVRNAGRANGRVLVDPIHVDRSGGSPAEIASIPPALIDYAQICDAHGPRPADFDTMIYQARNERAFPGEGNLGLAGMLRALPPGVPLSLECPTNQLAKTLPAVERARRGRMAIESLLASIAA
jgi:sugar phosphate isomerase/epimerase